VMRRVERAGILVRMYATAAAHAPPLDPIAVLVELGDTGVAITVADEDVVVGIPRDVGRAAEVAIDVRRHRGTADDRLEVVRLVRPLRTPAEIQRDVAGRIEFRDRLRSFVDRPEIVVAIEANAVTVAEPVDVLADLAHVLARGVELEQLRRGVSVERPAR